MQTQYLENFKQLVAFSGDIGLIDQTLSYIQEMEGGLGPKIQIERYTKIDFSYKLALQSSTSNNVEKGIFRTQWIDKITLKVPSVLVYVYNWTQPMGPNDRWEERISVFSNEIQKVREQIIQVKKANVRLILLLYMGTNNQLTPGAENAISQIKKENEIEGKRFIEIRGDKDIFNYIKKIKKQIVEDSSTFYEEIYNRLKEEVKKLQQDNGDRRLKLELKRSFIQQILGKQNGYKKHLDESYKIINQRIEQNSQQLTIRLKEIDQKNSVEVTNFILSNLDLFLKAQELRIIADLIKFRIILMQAPESSNNDLIQQFEIHLKNKRNAFQVQGSILEFEEYKWRSEITDYFLQILMKYQKESVDYAVNLKVESLVQAAILNYIYRVQLLRNFKLNLQYDNITAKRLPSEYLGRSNILLTDNSNNEQLQLKNESKKIIYSYIINERFKEEQETFINLFVYLTKLFTIYDTFVLEFDLRKKIYMDYLKSWFYALKGDDNGLQRNIDIMNQNISKAQNLQQTQQKLVQYYQASETQISIPNTQIGEVTKEAIIDVPLNVQIKQEEVLIDPIQFRINTKCLDSLYLNRQCQNINRYAQNPFLRFPCYSKCAILIQLSIQSNLQNNQNYEDEIWIHKISVHSTQDSQVAGIRFLPSFQLKNPIKINANQDYQFTQLYTTSGPASIKNFFQIQVFWNQDSKDKNNFQQTLFSIADTEIENFEFDFTVESPSVLKFLQLFEMKVNVENKTNNDVKLFLSVKEIINNETKRQFLVVGLTKQQLNLLPKQKHTVKFLLMPFFSGKCHLPGIVIEQKIQGAKNYPLFDSSGLKQVLVVP